jgi:cell division protein FtsB
VVLPVVLVVLTLVVLGAGVFPTRTYLDKQAELADTRERLAELEAANAEAEARRDLLNTDAEIERLARDQLGLARPGEETYVVLPAPQPPVEVPDGWPFDHVGPVLADG